MFGCALFEDFKKMTKLLLKSYKKKRTFERNCTITKKKISNLQWHVLYDLEL